MYDKKSLKAEEFINDGEILDTLKYADENKDNLALIDKSSTRQGLEKDLTTGRQAYCLRARTAKELQNL